MSNLLEIKKALSVMILPGDVAELRIFDQNNKKYCGWFNNLDRMAEAAISHDDTAEGTYYTCNACIPEMLAIANNRILPCATASTEGNIERRRIFGLDIDPIRNPVKISSTDKEKEVAYNRTLEVKAWLRSQGWPLPVLGDSGNGYHLDYFVDLPNTPEIKKLYENVYKVIQSKYPKEGADVQGFADANRIWKVYGTMARKGENLPDRPHRQSKLLEVPEKREIVTLELLQKIADMLPKDAPKTPNVSTPPHAGTTTNGKAWNPEKLESWLKEHGAVIERTKKDGDITRFVLKACLMNPDHEGHREAEVHIDSAGIIGYKCHHNSCSEISWVMVREKLEPGYRERKNIGRETKNNNYEPENAIPELSSDEINRLNAAERSRKLELSLPDDHFISLYVKWLNSVSDGYQEYSITGALWILSAIAKGKFILPLKQERVKPNLWVFDIGRSTTSRKSTIVNKTRRITECATDCLLPNQDYSLEGYLESLSTKPVTNNVRDEAAGLLSKFHQKYNDGIFDLECQLYDGQDVEKTLASKGKKEPQTYKIINPYITKLYATTPENLSRVMSVDDFLSGYGYRWIFVYPNYPHARKPLEMETPEDIEAWSKVLSKIKSLHNTFDQLTGTVCFKVNPDAMSYYDAICQDLETKADESNNDVLNSVIGRSEIHILKIAMLIELGKKELSTTIDINSIETAAKMVTEFFIPSIMDLITRLQEDIKNNKIEKLISILRRLGGTAHRTKLLRDSHLVAKDFIECVETMQQSGAIQIVKNSESKGEIFILQDHNEKLDIRNVRNVRTTHIYTDDIGINAKNAKTDTIDVHHGIDSISVYANSAKVANSANSEDNNTVTELTLLLERAKSIYEHDKGVINSSNIGIFAFWFCQTYHPQWKHHSESGEYTPGMIRPIAAKLFRITPGQVTA